MIPQRRRFRHILKLNIKKSKQGKTSDVIIHNSEEPRFTEGIPK